MEDRPNKDIDRSRCRSSQLATTVANDFYSGQLDLSARGAIPVGWSIMPEVEAVTRLRRDGQPELTVRRFLTFVSAMERNRDSNRLWADAVELLASQPETFDPPAVSVMPLGELAEKLSAARMTRYHRSDTDAWQTIARSLHAGGGPVAHLVEQGRGDAVKLLNDLCSVDSEGRPRYPVLKGQKIGPLWVRVMAEPGGAEVENIDVVDIAVDIHVRKVTENLGVANTHGLAMDKAKPTIRDAWKSAVAGAEFGGPPGIAGTCAALDPALWAYGKYGCGHCTKAGKLEPIGEACRCCQKQL